MNAENVFCVLSVTAMTLVYSIPQAESPPSKVVTRIPGQLAVFDCQVPGIIPWTVGWHKDGQPVTELGSRFMTKAKTGKLVIFVERMADEGNYTCYATSGDEFQPYTVFLVVSLLPEISVTSSNPVQPMEGDEITITCEAFGKPRPDFEWFSSQEIRLLPQSSSTWERMTVQQRKVDNFTTESSLIVSHVLPEDRGLFTCIATNNIGTLREEIAVDVQYAPKMLTSNETKEVYWWEGHRLNLTCQSRGNPAPVVIWSPDNVITPVVSVSQGIRVSSTLWISESMTHNFPASFKCHAENRHGETESRYFSISQVYAPPSPLLTVVSIKEDELILSIIVPWQKATPISTYVTVDYQHQSSSRWMKAGKAFEGNSTILTLRGIMLGYLYDIKVKIINQVGFSNDTSLQVFAEEYPEPETATQKIEGKDENQGGSSQDIDKNMKNDTIHNEGNSNNETRDGIISRSVESDTRLSPTYTGKSTSPICALWLIAVTVLLSVNLHLTR